MKKLAVFFVVTLLSAVTMVLAAMDDVTFTATSLKPATTQTNSFVMRGALKAIEVTPTTPQSIVSNTVVVTSGSVTLFSKAITNAVTFYPMQATHLYTGAACTNVSTDPIYAPASVAGSVTVTQTGLGPATNTWAVKLIWDK